jgi:sodium/potassium-transporting ATPase subunit alpha
MDDFNSDPQMEDKSRVRWQAVDEENENITRGQPRPLTRTLSSSSNLSIRGLSRRTSIDPSVALPIQYRSVYGVLISNQR